MQYMSAVLLVTRDKKQVAKAMVAESGFVIGRAPDCNLPLNEPLASRRHAELVFERECYVLSDLGSRNGTFVNGNKITTRCELRDGDEIEIGSTRMKFIWDKSRGEDEDDDKTRAAFHADSGKESQGRQTVRNKNNHHLQVKLRVSEGPLQGGVFRDWEGPLTIGRSLNNNVVLLDEAVSTAHAQIVQDGEAYFIVDLDSCNGTFLEGVKVNKTQLRNGQKIKVGISTLIFDMVDLRKKRRRLIVALIVLTVFAATSLAIKYCQPPDIAGQHVAIANLYAQQGELTNALAEFETALKADPNRAEAKRGLADIKEVLGAKALLTTAEHEAAAENYERANEFCYRVLRDFPKNSRALELQAVIKSIENAKIASAALNWDAAIRLLEKAQESYPKSELIRLRLDQAQKELTAQQNLAQANDALQHQQPDMAQPLLQSIPTNSVYFTDAKQALDDIARNQQVQKSIANAQELYREGHITEALTAIDSGLQQASDNKTLLDLQNHVRQMAALVPLLASSEAMVQSENVPSLLRDQKTCADVVALESDPLNSVRQQAQTDEAKIKEKLIQSAQASAARAAEILQTGNRKDALRLYALAVQATPNDQSIVNLRDQLREKIVADCRTSYRKGIVYEELGQSDLARTAYKEVLKIGIPGEDYYERASRKLEALGP